MKIPQEIVYSPPETPLIPTMHRRRYRRSFITKKFKSTKEVQVTQYIEGLLVPSACCANLGTVPAPRSGGRETLHQPCWLGVCLVPNSLDSQNVKCFLELLSFAGLDGQRKSWVWQIVAVQFVESKWAVIHPWLDSTGACHCCWCRLRSPLYHRIYIHEPFCYKSTVRLPQSRVSDMLTLKLLWFEMNVVSTEYHLADSSTPA